MTLYHYYDASTGPFRNLSDLPVEEAKSVLHAIKEEKPETRSAGRDENYIVRRKAFEAAAREQFLQKGGRPERQAPHFMVVEACGWLESGYENSRHLAIPIDEFDLSTLSFTYGDMLPTFSPRVNDGKEYRRQVYLYDGILKLIEKYGLPQVWNPDGKYGLERYIEVQIWSDKTVSRYR